MDSRKSNEKTKSSTTSTVELPPPISASEALMVNALCVLLGLRLLDCEHCLLHRTRYSSFSHTLLHLDYRAPHYDPSIQSISSTKSKAMHGNSVFLNLSEIKQFYDFWGYSKVFVV
ncbi:uncharacterized protein LOC114366849 [Glycine soja]|uniref:uncharacterized protein LOC114366849 n=1 Tax=Glycine soja TaxID=3848 RepID=UPI001039D34B|nr:uncharacterized protein LOC114366849 [Glycine soja]